LVYAQEFHVGLQYDTIACRANPEQSYALYLPSGYNSSEDNKYPVLYIFEPAARGSSAIKIFKPLAEEYGYIIIASNNSRNGSWDIVFDAADAIFKDSYARFKIDTTRIYLTGFSGGSRAALTIASVTNRVKGVIGCGAGLSPLKNYHPTSKNTFVYYGLIGTRDMNYLEMECIRGTLSGINLKNRLHVFDGPHRWPPESALSFAFDWMEINAGNVAIVIKAKNKWLARADSLFATEEYLLYQTEISDINTLFSESQFNNNQRLDSVLKYKAYKAEVNNRDKWQAREQEWRLKYLQGLTELAFTKWAGTDSLFKDGIWWQNEVKMLNKYVKNKDLYKSRMASRLLNMITASCAETLWRYVQQNDMVTAVNLTSLWLYINPECIRPNWTAVRIYAMNKDRKKTIKYLKKVVDLGIKPTKAMLKNPNLEFVKDTDAYVSLATLVQ